MKPNNKQAGRFYLLPKIHKVSAEELFTADIPGRPIVSNNNTPTEALSIFLNHCLSDIPSQLASYVQDTPHFLRILETLNKNDPLSDQTILVTLDVSALYTNIPINEGIDAVSKALIKNPHQHAAEVYLTLLRLVLTLNYFEFDSKYFLQIFGTSMGTPFAPTYANIFMGILEADLLDSFPHKPLLYLRYIDDIFMIWEHGRESLESFFTHCNSWHPSIKFSYQYSENKINFLDTTVIVESGKLSTTLYRKPMDRQQYLDFTSHHPRHCKQGIFVGQATRLRRICSDDSDYYVQLDKLQSTLASRHHPESSLKQAHVRAIKLERNVVLEKRQKSDSERPLPFVTKYSNALPNINNILRKYYPILSSSDRLKKIFPQAPRVTYRRPPNLKDMLVHAKITSAPEPVINFCSRPRCKTCKHLQKDCTVNSTASNYAHKVNSRFSCMSSNVIYMLECSTCRKQYIGETGQPMSMRLNGHRADTLKNLPIAVAKHFNQPGHNFDDLKLYILQSNFKSAMDRKYRESFLIHKFNSLEPQGINLSRGNLESLRYGQAGK